MIDSAGWFTEVYPRHGSAFSIKVKAKLESVQSPFQHIEIYDTDWFGRLMIIDGCTMVSDRDNFLYHEMMTHPVLFRHPQPKRVWIIGGGDCGSLREVLRHPGVEKAIQIEIDEQVTRLAERYFADLCASNQDPRAELLFIDGIQYVRDAPDQSVDVIIVDSTDPVGPAEGLFNAAFYRECLRCLGPTGLLVQQSESPLFHEELIVDMHATMRGAGFAQTETFYFPQCLYPSGWWSGTMASQNPIPALRETAVREAASFALRYYNAEVHKAAFATPNFMRDRLAALPTPLMAP